jgi:thymidylate synthase
VEITGESLDAVLNPLYRELLKGPGHNEGSRGSNTELLAVVLRIAKPRARLSRSENRGHPFSALGELLWYLSKSDALKFIEPYVPRYKDDAENGILFGAYGPRIFSMRNGTDQLASVFTLLRKKPGSRRAVIQLFNAEDIAEHHKEVPCTTTLQFFVRDDLLHLAVSMRSNDACLGLPHDVFCFTMLQEMVARKLGVELGEYYHFAGSMHVYDRHLTALSDYLQEGYQKDIEMPPMPTGDPFLLVPQLLQVEDRLRHGEIVVASETFSESYWADVVRLLQTFWASGRGDQLDVLKAEFTHPIYRYYLESRRNMKPRTHEVRDGKQA